jgi:transaldolase
MHENIVVKVPLIAEGLKAVRTLSEEGIRTNVTLCFSVTQGLLAAKAGATYISPFIGRVDDIAGSGMELVQQLVTVYGNYGLDTKVLAASIRHPLHVVEASLLGADVATIPHKVIHQLLKHPLTDIGLERFLADAKKIPSR